MSDDADSLYPFDPFNPFPEPVTIPITDVFDLHTIQPRDVKLVVEEYLQEASPPGVSQRSHHSWQRQRGAA